MSNHPYQFPEDLTGEASRNYVQNEDRAIPTRYERIFVPAGGPFFSHTMRIIDTDTGLELAPVNQYKCLHLQNEATLDSGQQVCCIVVITDDNVDHIRISYQAVGGKYGEVVTTLREIVDDIDWDKITRISWGSNVYGKPELYPAAPHRHDADDFTGWSKVVTALQSIYQAMIIKDGAVWESVYAYMHRQIKMAFDALGYTKQTLDDEFASVRSSIGAKKIRSNYTRNLITLRDDGVYFNDNYRMVNVTNTYTLTASDLGTRTIVRVTTTDARTVTVPKIGSTINVGSTVHIRRITGPVVVAAASGVTITHLVSNRTTLGEAGALLTLVYTGSDTWDVMQTTTEPVTKSANSLMQGIPVGGIVFMNIPFATAAAFGQYMGYGKWMRHAEGRAIVGRIPGNTDWKGTIGRTFGTDSHTLTLDEIPSHTHGVAPYNRFGSKASESNGETQGSGDYSNMVEEYATGDMTVADWEASLERPRGGGKPHNNVPPSIIADAWVRINDDGTYTPPPVAPSPTTPPPIDVTTSLSELTLTMSDVVTHLGSGSARFERYSTAISTLVRASGFIFPIVPTGSISNYSTADWWNAGQRYSANHWKSKVASLAFVEPYTTFIIPLPTEYNATLHRVELTGEVTLHEIIGNTIKIRLRDTYRTLTSGDVTAKFWQTNPQTFTVKILNKV